jgi:predicted NUDIX family phosphoesterase
VPARQQVFVVDRDAFFGGDWPQGYHQIEQPGAFLAQAMRLGRFVDRAQAEQNPSWKQWIPYCMLRCGPWSSIFSSATTSDIESERGVFLVQRTKKGGEARLHESWSIGLGGHIEPIDCGPDGSQPASGVTEHDAQMFFADALGRELSEELRLPTPDLVPPPRLLGLINDDSTEVGKVHAGLAYSIDFPQPLTAATAQVGIREVAKMRGRFTSLVEFANLWQTPSSFETWSQFLIQAEIVGAIGGSHRYDTDSAKN